MKRSDALAGLSREHHQALFVALGLRRATAESAGEAGARFRDYFGAYGDHHFDEEERVLVPVLAAVPDGPAMATRLVEEHRRLRALAENALADAASPEDLRTLGDELEAHVRFEERELFPAIEAALTPDELARVGHELDG